MPSLKQTHYTLINKVISFTVYTHHTYSFLWSSYSYLGVQVFFDLLHDTSDTKSSSPTSPCTFAQTVSLSISGSCCHNVREFLHFQSVSNPSPLKNLLRTQMRFLIQSVTVQSRLRRESSFDIIFTLNNVAICSISAILSFWSQACSLLTSRSAIWSWQ